MRALPPRLAFVLFALAFIPIAGLPQKALPASGVGYGSVQLTWKVVPMIKMSVTPNYASGFGPQGGAGSGSTPAPGPGASGVGTGIVDFGSNVVQGYEYLYKYALEASVDTNDNSGFTVYAEGATQVVDTTATPSPATVPINTVLFWLPSATANTPFSGATPFQSTGTGVSTCPVPTNPYTGTTPCNINYPGAPPAIAKVWSYPTETTGLPLSTVNQGFDYQLRLDNYPNADTFAVYIVYTAVAN